MVDTFIVYVFMEVLGAWAGSFVILVLVFLLAALGGMANSLGGCTERLVAA